MSLERIVDESMAKICKKQLPDLFRTIQELVNEGIAPKQIEVHTGTMGTMGDLVFHTARYLKENRQGAL